jgi:hypothetical protein
MTPREVSELITARDGRLCIRLHRRADGTVITKNCPVGLRAYKVRVSKFAGAAVASILSLFSVTFAQKAGERENAVDGKITRITSSVYLSSIRGSILDPNGAVVPGAEIRLCNKETKKCLKTESDVDGGYSLSSIQTGTYELRIKSPGFTKRQIKNIEINNNEELDLNIFLEPASVTVTVGILAEESLIDTTSSSITHTITRRQLENLPR